jgi:hypothetical protein
MSTEQRNQMVHRVVWLELKSDLVTARKMSKDFATIEDADEWAATINPQGDHGRILPAGGDRAAQATRGYTYCSGISTQSGKWGVLMTKKGHSEQYRASY